MENKYRLFDDTPNLYQRIKELEDKLKIAVDCLVGVKNAGNCWCAVESCHALEQLGELK